MQDEPEQKVFFSQDPVELDEAPLLQGLDAETVNYFTGCCEEVKKDRGAYLVYEGDEAEGFFIVNKGIAKVVKISLEGKESILHLVYPGGLVGEAPVFHDTPSPVSAFALTDMVLSFVPKKIILDLARENGQFAINLLRILSLRERMLCHKLGATQLQASAKSRLCGWIIHRRVRMGTKKITIGMSQEVLAKLLGVARETLNREMVALTKAGVISASSGEIEILDLKELKKIRDE